MPSWFEAPLDVIKDVPLLEDEISESAHIL